MFRHRFKSAHRARRGAAVLEVAFVLPIFVTVVIGIIQFGRLFDVQQILTSAAREGARHGVLPKIGNSVVESKIREHLRRARIDPDLAHIEIAIFRQETRIEPADLDLAKSGDSVHVTVGLHFRDVSFLRRRIPPKEPDEDEDDDEPDDEPDELRRSPFDRLHDAFLSSTTVMRHE